MTIDRFHQIEEAVRIVLTKDAPQEREAMKSCVKEYFQFGWITSTERWLLLGRLSKPPLKHLNFGA